MAQNIERWRGFVALVGDAVKEGASAVERVHLATARRPFAIIERVAGVGPATESVHAVHDAAVSSVYASVRVVTSVVAKAVDVTLDIASQRTTDPEPVTQSDIVADPVPKP